MIKFKDVTGQEVFVNGPFVVLIPGLLSANSKCVVIAMGTVSEVTREEADRLRTVFEEELKHGA